MCPVSDTLVSNGRVSFKLETQDLARWTYPSRQRFPLCSLPVLYVVNIFPLAEESAMQVFFLPDVIYGQSQSSR